jgi:hypothetical protein
MKSKASASSTSRRIDPKALNATLVSQLSNQTSRNDRGRSAAAEAARTGKMPPAYHGPARRVTMTIVALPIAIVTSYVLYQRCEYSLSISFLPRWSLLQG